MPNLPESSAPQSRTAWWKRKPPTGVAGAVFWLALWFGLLWLIRQVPSATSPLLAWMQVLVGLALIGLAIPLAWRLIQQHLLWSLRNKLILTYLLIGLAPVILFVTLAAISAYVAAGQFSIHLADTRMRQQLDEIGMENASRASRLGHILHDANAAPPGTGTTTRFGRPGGPGSHNGPQAGSPPPTQAAAEAQTASGPEPSATAESAGQPGIPLGLPSWAADLHGNPFRGLVLDGQDLYLVAIDQRHVEGAGILSVITSLPVNGELMDAVAAGLGRVRLTALMTGNTANASRRPRNNIERAVYGGAEPMPVNFCDLGVPFVSTMYITDWDTGDPDNVPIVVHSRPSLLYRQLFGSSLGGIVTSYIRYGLFGLCIVFAVIEIIALRMALRLSASVTSSVEELYFATQRVDRGDFVGRIPAAHSGQKDQLGELSRSFNRMTGSLEKLMIEQQEKERLQSELSIAQEVQANLFPRNVRDLPTLQLHGVCRPARSVSGDYYDFLIFHHPNGPDGSPGSEAGVGIAVGDISGKGISAALLMATLHSAVRAYQLASEDLVYSENAVTALTVSKEALAGDGGKLFEQPGPILSLLNRHLYRSTQPSKYATLFLAHYDVSTAQLTYSNAGHLPPLVLGRDGKLRRLDCGGTVVGLMDGMRYEEDRIQMKSGDVLVCYSDGVTEPENDFGDFGEERLMEVVARYRDQPLHVISSQVMLALDAWIGAEEQPDDITLVLARQV
jgi:sigma-B regulation protein RsbU (phosphoserine phosphatase)